MRISTNNPSIAKITLLHKRILVLILTSFTLLTLVYFLMIYSIEEGLSDFLDKHYKYLVEQRKQHFQNQRYKLDQPVDLSKGTYYDGNSVREDFIAMLFLAVTTGFVS